MRPAMRGKRWSERFVDTQIISKIRQIARAGLQQTNQSQITDDEQSNKILVHESTNSPPGLLPPNTPHPLNPLKPPLLLVSP